MYVCRVIIVNDNDNNDQQPTFFHIMSFTCWVIGQL